MTVAAFKGAHHSGDGEGQQEKPDDDGDLWSFFQHFDKIPPAKMHHIKVAIDRQGDEEGDTGTSVEKQHEEHRLAHHIILAAPQVVTVMEGLGRETGHQQEISNHDVKQEDTFVLPEFKPKEEEIDKHLFRFTIVKYIWQ